MGHGLNVSNKFCAVLHHIAHMQWNCVYEFRFYFAWLHRRCGWSRTTEEGWECYCSEIIYALYTHSLYNRCLFLHAARASCIVVGALCSDPRILICARYTCVPQSLYALWRYHRLVCIVCKFLNQCLAIISSYSLQRDETQRRSKRSPMFEHARNVPEIFHNWLSAGNRSEKKHHIWFRVSHLGDSTNSVPEASRCIDICRHFHIVFFCIVTKKVCGTLSKYLSPPFVFTNLEVLVFQPQSSLWGLCAIVIGKTCVCCTQTQLIHWKFAAARRLLSLVISLRRFQNKLCMRTRLGCTVADTSEPVPNFVSFL